MSVLAFLSDKEFRSLEELKRMVCRLGNWTKEYERQLESPCVERVFINGQPYYRYNPLQGISKLDCYVEKDGIIFPLGQLPFLKAQKLVQENKAQWSERGLLLDVEVKPAFDHAIYLNFIRSKAVVHSIQCIYVRQHGVKDQIVLGCVSNPIHVISALPVAAIDCWVYTSKDHVGAFKAFFELKFRTVKTCRACGGQVPLLVGG